MKTLQRLSMYSLAFLGFLLIPAISYAASIVFVPSGTSINQRQQFYVDVLLDTDTESFNGIEGVLTYPKDILRFVRSEDGGSVVSFWIEKSANQTGVVHFSGIMPNGFAGMINPFESSIRKPGKVIRLVFEGTHPGTGALVFQSVHLTKNDGMGTLENPSYDPLVMTVTDMVAPAIYTPVDTVAPELTVSILTDPLISTQHPVLIYHAVDKDSGIARVELQQNNGGWNSIVSPYVLTRVAPGDTVRVRAVDVAGQQTEQVAVVSSDVVPRSSKTRQSSALLITIGIVLAAAILIRRYEKK